jgi:hypothetical protein
MAQQNFLLANGRLFARKGEAAPSAVVPGFGRESMPHKSNGGSAAAGKHSHSDTAASVLSTLIVRRRVGPVAGETASDSGQGASRPTAKRLSKNGSERTSDINPVLRALVKKSKSGDRRRPRRKLTLRLCQDDFARIRSLTEFLDTTYQSILEKGVVNYVESLSTGVCAPEDVDQAIPISAGQSQR